MMRSRFGADLLSTFIPPHPLLLGRSFSRCIVSRTRIEARCRRALLSIPVNTLDYPSMHGEHYTAGLRRVRVECQAVCVR